MRYTTEQIDAMIATNTNIAKEILNKEYENIKYEKLREINLLLSEFYQNTKILRDECNFEGYYDVGGLSRMYTSMYVTENGYTHIPYLALVQVAAQEVTLTTENEEEAIKSVSIRLNGKSAVGNYFERFDVLRVEIKGKHTQALVTDRRKECATDYYHFRD